MGRLPWGPSVKKARVRLSLTQEELGKKLNPAVSNSTIAQWENHKTLPSNLQKAEIKRVLGEISSEITDLSTPEGETMETVGIPSAIGSWLNKARLNKGLFSTRIGIGSRPIFSLNLQH